MRIPGWCLARWGEQARAVVLGGALFVDPMAACLAHGVAMIAVDTPALWAARDAIRFTPLEDEKATDFRVLAGLATALLLRRDVDFDDDDALRLAAEIALPRGILERWPLELVVECARVPADVVVSWANWTSRTPRLDLVRGVSKTLAPIRALRAAAL